MRSSRPTAMSAPDLPRPARRAYRAVVVSPHWDDAVFSCAGLLARLGGEGPVLVVNLFTRYLGEDEGRGIVAGGLRGQEEAYAAARLGYESLDLGELDVSFRQAAYRSLGRVFGRPSRQDLAWLPWLRQRVFRLLEGLEFDALYVPLGVGWHVDHVLACALFDGWRGPAALWYYEDLPYGLMPGATRLRLAELGRLPGHAEGRGLARRPWPLAWWAACAWFARCELMRRIRPGWKRCCALPVVWAYLGCWFWRHRERPGRRHAWSWEAHKLEALPGGVKDKAEAMSTYASQFPVFFADRGDCEARLIAHASGFSAPGRPAERYWRRHAADGGAAGRHGAAWACACRCGGPQAPS